MERQLDSNNVYSLLLKQEKVFKQGENAHQNAELYTFMEPVDYDVMFNKELSFNNIIDLTQCCNILSEFFDVNACVIIKNSSLCAAALGQSIADSWQKAIDCNPLGVVGSCVGFSQVINEALAKQFVEMNLDVIIAPDYTPKALLILENKPIKVIKLNTPLNEYKKYKTQDIKVTPFGTLIQTPDFADLNKDNFNVVTKNNKPTVEMIEDMIFAWKIVKHIKSCAVVVSKDFKTIGIAQGQTNYIEAFEIALNNACDGSKDAIAAIDGSIESINNIHVAAQGRISGIIQSGNALCNDEIFKNADKYNIAMITTGITHKKF